jgi:hypothetical protein
MTTNTHILWRRPKSQQYGDSPCAETIEPATKTLFPLRGTHKSLAIEKCLPMKSMLQLPGDHRGERISCLSGVIWITQSGNPEDILLYAGRSFTITQKGTILMQGLTETRLKIISLHPAKTGWRFPSVLL